MPFAVKANTTSLLRALAPLLAILAIVVLGHASPRITASSDSDFQLGPLALLRASAPSGGTQVIVRTSDLGAARAAILAVGGTLGRVLPSIGSQVAHVPNAALQILAANPAIERISLDRLAVGAMERTGATVGAAAVRQELGLDGAGVGIAIIDSGVTPWHDDLAGASGPQRVDHFVDFVGGRPTAYDDYGHGTHVAGIVAGNGYDSHGRRTGIAPGSSLTVLKALDASGRGRISDVIAAIEYAVAHRAVFNIRIINLSIATGVYESFETDPLTVAAKRAVQAGITVVAASGNNGVSPEGRTRYGGTTAPGNAPWVLTVGGSSHMGTVSRSDDTVAGFSSRGPSAIDHVAKPDVVAPSVGIESLAAPDSTLYSSMSAYLLGGSVPTTYMPYLSLSGTSMAAPVVTGTVALMLQANPALTPNAVKAILQYTAEGSAQYDPLTQGAGFLNARGAVALARHFAAPARYPYPATAAWSARLIWGNYLMRNGRLTGGANAWPADVTWGDRLTPTGGSVAWGVVCANAACDASKGPWTWPDRPRNVVWGRLCEGANCTTTWTLQAVSGSSNGDTVVWGTDANGDTVVWGTDNRGETVVWGTSEGDTVVWGTSCSHSGCSPTLWK